MKIVRKSNDPLTAISLTIALLMSAGVGAISIVADDHRVQSFATLFAAAVLLGCVVLIYRIVVPREFELTIDFESIHFGITGQPSSHRSILRSSVRCVVFDTDEASLCIDTGGWIATPLAPDIIIYKSQMQLIADYIKEHWHGVPVVGQLEFQQMCRSRT